MEKGKAVGATDYITKFDAKMLGEKLAYHLDANKTSGSKAA